MSRMPLVFIAPTRPLPGGQPLESFIRLEMRLVDEAIFGRCVLKVILRHAPAVILFHVRPQGSVETKVDEIKVIVRGAFIHRVRHLIMRIS